MVVVIKPGYELLCLKKQEVVGLRGGTTAGDTMTRVGWGVIRGGVVVETSGARPPHSSGVASPGIGWVGALGGGSGVVGDSLGAVGDSLGAVGDLLGAVGDLLGVVGDSLGVVGDLLGVVGDSLGVVGGNVLDVVGVCLSVVFGDGPSGLVVVVSAGSSCGVGLSRGTKELAE